MFSVKNLESVVCSLEEYDYDMDEDTVKEFDVGKILPVIIVFKDNKEVLRIVGEKKKTEIEKMLGEL